MKNISIKKIIYLFFAIIILILLIYFINEINIKNKNTVIKEGYEFKWEKKYIDENGVIVENGNPRYNTYITPIKHFKEIDIRLESEDVAIKIVYYDDNNNYIYDTGWISKGECEFCNVKTQNINIKNKKIRISINTIKENLTDNYTRNVSDYQNKYRYTIIEGQTKKTEKHSIETIKLPDVKHGDNKKGFTITGLTYSAEEKIFYASNFGPMIDGEIIKNSTIVKLSHDMRSNLGEIDLYNLYGDKKHLQPQGITIDQSNNTIFFVDVLNGKINNITTSGKLINSFKIENYAPGLVYDSRTDTLWSIDSTSLKNIKKDDGKILKEINTNGIEHIDQLYLDEQENIMYLTAGANYHGNNYIYKIDLSTGLKQIAYILEDSYAIEGIYINGTQMYIANDGYYHRARIKKNIIQVYEIN